VEPDSSDMGRMPAVLVEAGLFSWGTRVSEKLHKSKVVSRSKDLMIRCSINRIYVRTVSQRRPNSLLVPAQSGRVREPQFISVVRGARPNIPRALDREKKDFVGLTNGLEQLSVDAEINVEDRARMTLELPHWLEILFNAVEEDHLIMGSYSQN
jgi:hypothetical protein